MVDMDLVQSKICVMRLLEEVCKRHSLTSVAYVLISVVVSSFLDYSQATIFELQACSLENRRCLSSLCCSIVDKVFPIRSTVQVVVKVESGLAV